MMKRSNVIPTVMNIDKVKNKEKINRVKARLMPFLESVDEAQKLYQENREKDQRDIEDIMGADLTLSRKRRWKRLETKKTRSIQTTTTLTPTKCRATPMVRGEGNKYSKPLPCQTETSR